MQRLRSIRSFILGGPLLGALVHVALFASSLLHFGSGEYMGVKDDALIGRILGMFKSEILWLQAQLFGLQLLIGAVVGGLALTVVRAAQTALRPQQAWPTGWRQALRVLALVFAVHVWFLGHTMVEYPQVLYDAYFGASPMWRGLQIAVTDHLTPSMFNALAWVVLAVSVGLVVTALVRSGVAARALESPRVRQLAGGSGVVLGVFVGLLVLERPPPDTRRNILVLAVDSMRPDAIAESAEFPTLAAIAGESAVFDDAYTVMARTFPSWVSMLTGQYPHTHGIRHMFPSPENLAVRRDTVIDALRAKGYRTGVISDFAGDIFSRIELGFEDVRVPRFTLWSNVALGGLKLHYHLLPYLLTALGGPPSFPLLKLWERTPDPRTLTDEVWRWIASGDGRPFALVVFYSSAHFPYASPYPWYGKNTAADYDGPSRYHKAAWVNSNRAPGEDEQRQAAALFRGGMAAADYAIGTLRDRMIAAGLWENTSVVITADHGENLYEGGFGIGHGDHLRGTVSSRIPLYVKPAGPPAPRRLSNTVRSIDLGPTLAALGGTTLPAAEGSSLLGLARGKTRASDPPVFFETGLWFLNPEAEVLENRTMPFMQGFGAFVVDPATKEIYLDPTLEDDFLVAKHRAVLLDGWKLAYVPTRSEPLWELYDTKKDPLEATNVFEAHPEQVEILKPLLSDWIARDKDLRKLSGWFVARDVR
jgi:arylsulfatase A-like enzyme